MVCHPVLYALQKLLDYFTHLLGEGVNIGDFNFPLFTLMCFCKQLLYLAHTSTFAENCVFYGHVVKSLAHFQGFYSNVILT